ncbi:MAG: hypothetical protein NVSMB12_04650 [Acidimicrobiales bacterium]
MAERRHDPGLGSEPAEEALVEGEGIVEHFDRDAPAQGHVVGDVDVGRRSRPDGSKEPVPTSDDASDLISQAGTGHWSRG